eukprot:CAMPEP_0167752454 /NCGR_PEP_ID=MMETSP0110_2-20121227/7150_1 /TAXON_ID=629695 /ORGANISM="Gymnochlora sp., Strain CCMP2014" /LENGTH=546 /DNA_ID=CAMNT_0007638077 /DNA_START=104 /DNA_END=1747 /DNA_ORIENTATION=-
MSASPSIAKGSFNKLQTAGSGRRMAAFSTATAEKQDSTPRTIVTMDELTSLCKQRGFVFPSSELYGGYAGFWDYGPLGTELRRNIKDRWWQHFVTMREDIVGLDTSIIASPNIWKASGHVDGFSDPMVDCKGSKLRYRADQLFYAKVEAEDGTEIGYVCVQEADDMQKDAEKKAKTLLKAWSKEKGLDERPKLKSIALKGLDEATEEEVALVPSPATGKPGDLTPPRDFNLMFQTQVGALADDSATAFLRPETAQGIFVNYATVQRAARMKVPFGIAQIGKAFRNEITPRNFVFRSREFEQMEIEYFIPDDDTWANFHEKWLKDAWDWLVSIGMDESLMKYDKHEGHKLAHYARACTDIAFRFPFGTQELLGVAARGNYDLMQHQTASGKNQEYRDDVTKTKFVPHVIEPSIGVDRLMLALLVSAHDQDEVGGEKRTVMRFHPKIAPIKAAVFPLVKNKPELLDKARSVFKKLARRYNIEWDQAGAIGRRYRRMDEAGTPYCITVDFETLDDDTVTVRERDSTEQVRMPISELMGFLEEKIEGEVW